MLIGITDNWVSVPTNSVVTIHKQTVLLHPILDEFYSEDLNHDRSTCFAVSKGLVSTAPGTTVPPPNNDTCASSASHLPHGDDVAVLDGPRLPQPTAAVSH
jgi:glutamine amidotransferase